MVPSHSPYSVGVTTQRKAPTQAKKRIEPLAIWAIVFSLLGLAMLVPLVGSIIGIVFGNKAMDRVEKSGDRGGPTGQAAVIFGWFGVFEGVLAIAALALIITAAANRG